MLRSVSVNDVGGGAVDVMICYSKSFDDGTVDGTICYCKWC